jgi:hypothetical protein
MEAEKIKIPCHGNGEATVKGLTKEEFEKFMAAVTAGAYYIRVVEGRLEAVPIWEELPKPTTDEAMLPFWRQATKIEMGQKELFDEFFFGQQSTQTPSITIKHLCGYSYSPENYKFYAELLESYGFDCLRSRRGLDGKYWETWYLPDLFFAKGPLGDRLKQIDDNDKKLTVALEFLRLKVVFGVLDVSQQRLVQTMD